ncbi:MAG TPA: response regulator transcription factor [Microvirga sp.]|nr:response regulator transcription factor [Microvirga sp.]
MDNRIRVGVVDDHPLYRDGVVFTLAAHADIKVVDQGASAADAVRIATDNDLDVLLLDMTMPGGGLSAVETIARQRPSVKSLMLTVVAEEDQVCAALKHGARGYLLKGTGGPELVQAVRLISQGESYVSPSLAAKLLMRSAPSPVPGEKRPDPFSELTPREEQILSILVEGRSNKEIGNKLDLSEKTIKHHLTNILQKLQVRNRVEAALLASDRMAQRSPYSANWQR